MQLPIVRGFVRVDGLDPADWPFALKIGGDKAAAWPSKYMVDGVVFAVAERKVPDLSAGKHDVYLYDQQGKRKVGFIDIEGDES